MSALDIESIRALLDKPFHMTQHAEQRRRQRGISIQDIKNAILCGDVIENYPDDYPYPSCLIMGYTEQGSPLHLVCGVGEGELFVITAYRPDPMKWYPDWTTRKEL